MRLESHWNISYLEHGYVTPEMNQISDQIKNCRRELVQSDEMEAKFEVKALEVADDFISVAT
tara:strand:- start:684 stop:869 length:186 start_codon:yes stop_codon:yes gene_type:complete